MQAKRVTVILGTGRNQTWEDCVVTLHPDTPAWELWRDKKHIATVPVGATVIELE